MTGERRFVFLDKDGTLVEDVPYNVDLAKIRLVPGAVAALRSLRDAGFGLAIVSNQSGVARGYCTTEQVLGAARFLVTQLAAEGIHVEAFYFCPHHPLGRVEAFTRECDCRKPAPGLIRRAVRDLAADVRASWLVGDILDDVEAGGRAGCRTALVDVGHETEWRRGRFRTPDIVAPDLPGAARAIVELSRVGSRAGTLSAAVPAAAGAGGR